MDARERLRHFLEQRRDSGESEFVLDTMSVDEALALLGAAKGTRGMRDGEPPGASSSVRADHGPRTSPKSVASSEWREALRAIDSPPPSATHEVSRRERENPAVDPSGQTQTDSERSMPFSDDDSPSGEDVEGQATGRSNQSARETPDAVVPLSDIETGLVVGSAAHELFNGPASPFHSLDDVARSVASCTRCPLFKTAKHPVPGEGRADADLVCVGEAPGANEDETGRPFVGQAGGLLTKILAAIDLTREDVFIVNVLKHRPPGNRNPLPEEVAACSPYLVRQIELIRPKVIVAFGTFAAQTLLQTKEPLGKLRGKIHRYYGVPLIVTYHPAALLRNPSWKRPTWEDVKLARRLLDRAIGA